VIHLTRLSTRAAWRHMAVVMNIYSKGRVRSDMIRSGFPFKLEHIMMLLHGGRNVWR
jgi:hypothetical protein